ncbi:MAG: adenylate/guanylate cyclase domain-containing protein [Myxococcota bacterium]|nr:adenylate/guanylate cyclase domain-containing protein [Myxococcota bacterium]
MPLAGWVALAGLLALSGLFAALWWRSRRQASRLRHRLEVAALDLQRLQRSFAHFAPDALVERIIARGLHGGGEYKEITVLFADLVGFTPLAERLEPGALLEVLNGYYERMSRAISDHQGYVSTLLGDGILALFGALEPNPWHANDAVHAALAMRAELDDYNAELARRGLPTLALGIGLHRGSGVVGLVGSSEKQEFTLVGRTINVAARVSDLTRDHDGADILVTGDLRDVLAPQFVVHALPPARLRGIREPVPLFAVEGYHLDRASEAGP